MNSIFSDILNQVNVGIIVLDEKLRIIFWNNFMEQITNIDKDKALNQDVYEVLPSLKRNYFEESLKSSLEKDYKPFFAAAMHRGLVTDKAEVNVRVSAFKNNHEKFLMLECIDVTSQFIRVNQLKQYVKELSELNKELREKEKEIARLAYYDKLTGVANRVLFYNLADKYLKNAERNKTVLGLMFIDVDNFKCINDTYGHKAGDKVLIEVANILTKTIRANDLVARYGGDEFVILLPDVKRHGNYEFIASRLTNVISKIEIDDVQLKVSLSIGISFFPQDGDNIDELVLKADRAMYQAKSVGGNKCFSYVDSMAINCCSLLPKREGQKHSNQTFD